MAKRKIILTKHAQERMKSRGVRLEDIKATVSAPSSKLPARSDGTQELRKVIGDRKCFVVVGRGKTQTVIVTTGWVS